MQEVITMALLAICSLALDEGVSDALSVDCEPQSGAGGQMECATLVEGHFEEFRTEACDPSSAHSEGGAVLPPPFAIGLFAVTRTISGEDVPSRLFVDLSLAHTSGATHALAASRCILMLSRVQQSEQARNRRLGELIKGMSDFEGQEPLIHEVACQGAAFFLVETTAMQRTRFLAHASLLGRIEGGVEPQNDVDVRVGPWGCVSYERVLEHVSSFNAAPPSPDEKRRRNGQLTRVSAYIHPVTRLVSIISFTRKRHPLELHREGPQCEELPLLVFWPDGRVISHKGFSGTGRAIYTSGVFERPALAGLIDALEDAREGRARQLSGGEFSPHGSVLHASIRGFGDDVSIGVDAVGGDLSVIRGDSGQPYFPLGRAYRILFAYCQSIPVADTHTEELDLQRVAILLD